MSPLRPLYGDQNNPGRFFHLKSGDDVFNAVDVIRDTAQSLIDYDISNAPATRIVKVLGFNKAFDGGGDVFLWDESKDKSNHNGIDVWDPEHSATPGSDAWLSDENTGTGCWIRHIGEELLCLSMGIFPDSGEYERVSIQYAIDYLSDRGGGTLKLVDGKYLVNTALKIKDDVTIKGESKYGTVIETDVDTETPLSVRGVANNATDILSDWLNDIDKGDEQTDIDNNFSVDDFVIFNTTENFNELYSGSKIRDYYEKGEMFRVKEATSSSVTFHGPSNMDLPVASKDHAEYFTPVRNIGVKDLTLKKHRREPDGYSQGFWCQGILYGEIENVHTINFNDTGIKISHSMHLSLKNISCIGGDTGQGTNYGIKIEEGSKHITVDGLYGRHCRHIIAIGGGATLNCVPIYASIKNMIAEESLSHSIDAHSYCMHMDFENGYVDKGVSVTGLFNSVKNIHSLGGRIAPYGGGFGLTYENIVCENTDGNYINENVRNSSFINIKYIVSPISDYRVGENYYNCSFKNVKFINRSIRDATSDSEADDTFNSYPGPAHPLVLTEDCVAEDIYIEGFPACVWFKGGNNSLENAKFRDCLWPSTYYTDSERGAIIGTLGSESTYIDNVLFEAVNDNFGNKQRYIHFYDIGTGNGDKIVLKNIRHGKEHVDDHYYGVKIDAAFDVFMMNVRLSWGGGGNDINASGRFIYNTGIADN